MARSLRAGCPLPRDQRYSQDDMGKLLGQATSYVECFNKNKKKTCPIFVRDKSAEYFHSVALTDGIMLKYVKDNHGDPRNPINGRLNGLFFTVNNAYKNNGRPPPTSIYGERRLSIPSSHMVKLAPKFYFSDFYCVSKTKPVHYVQLVMTTPGTDADLFCEKNLIRLDIKDNPFFCVQGDLGSSCCEVKKTERVKHVVCSLDSCRGQPVICHVTTNVWVEVLFSNCLRLDGNKYKLTDVQMVGQRSGGSTGLKKNSQCPVCNIQNVIAAPLQMKDDHQGSTLYTTTASVEAPTVISKLPTAGPTGSKCTDAPTVLRKLSTTISSGPTRSQCIESPTVPRKLSTTTSSGPTQSLYTNTPVVPLMSFTALSSRTTLYTDAPTVPGKLRTTASSEPAGHMATPTCPSSILPATLDTIVPSSIDESGNYDRLAMHLLLKYPYVYRELLKTGLYLDMIKHVKRM